jgi:uncharacterized membrane protein YadS
MPWSVLGFVALITINSLFPVPAAIKSPVGIMTAFGLSVALAAMGFETDVRKLPACGHSCSGLLPFPSSPGSVRC